MGMGVPKFGGSPKFCDTGTDRVSTALIASTIILRDK